MNNEEKMNNRRKLLLMAPVLTVPFITMFFWALGGAGKEHVDDAPPNPTGFNTNLPEAASQPDDLDKMAYYNQAIKDSLDREEQRKRDPLYQPTGQASDSQMNASDMGQLQGMNYGTGYSSRQLEQEAAINARLNQLNRTIAGNDPGDYVARNNHSGYSPSSSSLQKGDIDRLEKMMKSMSTASDEDPEMAQLDGMLSKIMQIQNPSIVREQLRLESDKKRGRVFSVSSQPEKQVIGSLENHKGKRSQPEPNGFHPMETDGPKEVEQNTVKALAAETQTLSNGANIRLRLGNDIYVNGTLVPKGTLVTGAVALSGERLGVKITAITYKGSLFPVDLVVYDVDGSEGIYVPGAISREVAKASAESSMQGLGINSFDQSLGIQAAGLGIEAAKGFLSKKVKLVRVTVKAGYELLLYDGQQQHNK